MEDYTDALFAGEPSSSRGNVYGDSKKIILPNSGITMRVSTLYRQLSDPRDERLWIPVSIPASLSFEDYAAGKDPAINRRKDKECKLSGTPLIVSDEIVKQAGTRAPRKSKTLSAPYCSGKNPVRKSEAVSETTTSRGAVKRRVTSMRNTSKIF